MASYLRTTLFEEGIVIDLDADTVEALHYARQQEWRAELMRDRVFMELLNELRQSRVTTQRPIIPEVELRVALEGEDPCCVCLENFPNATFVGCQKSNTVCCFCAEIVLANRMRCPHCRAKVRKYVAGPL